MVDHRLYKPCTGFVALSLKLTVRKIENLNDWKMTAPFGARPILGRRAGGAGSIRSPFGGFYCHTGKAAQKGGNDGNTPMVLVTFTGDA